MRSISLFSRMNTNQVLTEKRVLIMYRGYPVDRMVDGELFIHQV